MDHSKMDHGDMGDMPGHGGGGHMDMCSMNMLFTWDTTNLCIVFEWWHVRTNFDLVLTLIAVVLMGMFYEYMRMVARAYDARTESAGKLF